MKFRLLLEDLLNEASPDEIYQKYYSDITPTNFFRIVSSDPGSKTDGKKILKIGKYSKILLNIFKKGNLKFEDLPKATEYLTLVYKHALKFDFNSVNNIDELYELVKDYIVKSKRTIASILEVLKPQTYNVILDGENWYVFKPNTEMAAAYLGVNTEWCTTWGKYCLNPDYKDRDNHFSSHNSSGPLFIMINKNDENDKYQLHFESDQLKNSADNELRNRGEFFDERPELKNALFPFINKNGLSKDEAANALSRSRKFLSSKDTEKVLKLFISAMGVVGGLPELILKQDVDGIRTLITDEHIESININDSELEIEMRDIGTNIESFDRGMSSLYSQESSAYDYIYDGEYYEWSHDEDRREEIIDGYLSQYYNEKESELKNKLGYSATSYEVFSETFMHDFVEGNNNKFGEVYVEKVCSITASNLENAYREEINTNKKYLKVDSVWSDHTIKIPIEFLVSYITEKEINVIENLDDFIGDYCDYYSLVNEEWYETPDYDYGYPSNEQMFEVFDDFFEKYVEELETNPECHKERIKFSKIIKKYFHSKSNFENEFVSIRIKDNSGKSFDCEKGIEIIYRNKKNAETYSGFVSLENLINYMNIEPLFEKKRLKLSDIL